MFNFVASCKFGAIMFIYAVRRSSQVLDGLLNKQNRFTFRKRETEKFLDCLHSTTLMQ